MACPGSQQQPIAATWSAHGMSTGMPAFTTTMVRSFTSATRRTSSSWSPGRASPGRSKPSLSVAGPDPTTTTAASAVRAASTASRSSASPSGAGTMPSRMATGPCGQSSGSSEIRDLGFLALGQVDGGPDLARPDHGLHRVGGHAGVARRDLRPVDRRA